MKLKQKLLLPLLCTLPVSLPAQDELEPPHVDFFAELQGIRTDYREVNADYADGTRLTIGTWLNDARRGDLQYALETSFSWMGESRSSRSFREETPSDPPIVLDIDETTRVDINTVSVAGRLMHEDAVFLKAGLLYYTKRERTVQRRSPADPDQASPDRLSETDRTSGISPHMSAGFQFPLSERTSLIAEYNSYWIDSTRLEGFGLGISYRLK